MRQGNKNRQTFGHTLHPLGKVYGSMIQRCHNETHRDFPKYGGRGITVCEEWRNDFWAFVNYVGERPEGTTLDRIDNNKGYEPGNVRWATPFEQNSNRRNSVWLTAFGETRLMSEWSRDARCVPTGRTFQRRIAAGWNAEEALITPAQPRFGKEVTL